jgi:hypothetical protein
MINTKKGKKNTFNLLFKMDEEEKAQEERNRIILLEERRKNLNKSGVQAPPPIPPRQRPNEEKGPSIPPLSMSTSSLPTVSVTVRPPSPTSGDATKKLLIQMKMKKQKLETKQKQIDLESAKVLIETEKLMALEKELTEREEMLKEKNALLEEKERALKIREEAQRAKERAQANRTASSAVDRIIISENRCKSRRVLFFTSSFWRNTINSTLIQPVLQNL